MRSKRRPISGTVGLRAFAAITMLLATQSASMANIISTTPAAVLIAPPADVNPGMLQSNTTIYVFDEFRDFTLPGALGVNIPGTPGFYNAPALLPGGFIPALTIIDSHFIHFDQVGPGTTALSGSVTFAGKIIGVMCRNGALNGSDFLGVGTAYPGGNPRRQLDWDVGGPVESITISPDQFTISFTLITSNVVDQIRVITEAGDTNPLTPSYVWEFSLDIGSDKELSDPVSNFDGGFDPGDVYASTAGPVCPPFVPGGADGFKDDAFIFGGDPLPAPPDAAVPPVTRVPVGNNCPLTQCYFNYFDLDGHDQIDFDLRQYIPQDGLQNPIQQSALPPSQCIYRPTFLAVSYDDDMPAGWPAGDVPTLAPSLTGYRYGQTANRDEIVGITLAGAVPPFSVTNVYPISDEQSLHPDLAPNPDNLEADDDDVDSLDIVEAIGPPGTLGGGASCPYWYFGADQEAVSPMGLDSGSIYLAVGGVPALVVDDVIHLGIPEMTDMDDFEFTWLVRMGPDGPVTVLGVVFTVDNDDPLTAPDESGGLDPRMIYASYMTGFSFPILPPGSPGLFDDIDGLTIWSDSLELCHCKGDMNQNGVLEGNDIQGFVDCVTSSASSSSHCDCADMNGDGVLDAVFDVADFVTALLNKSPC